MSADKQDDKLQSKVEEIRSLVQAIRMAPELDVEKAIARISNLITEARSGLCNENCANCFVLNELTAHKSKQRSD